MIIPLPDIWPPNSSCSSSPDFLGCLPLSASSSPALSLSSSISFDLGCTQMAESHLQTPLLTQNHHTQNHHTRTSSNYEPHLSLSIDSDQNFCNRSHENDQFEHENPFEFLGVDGFSIPPSSTADPFRNHTPRIEGIYEFVKIVICLPIAALRLVLFGLGLCIGYLATLIALLGWKDKHNPIPRWRCRFMWISRFCARCILFSFGYQWIKRKGHPAPREIAPIVVSNHVSYIEPIFFFYELFPTIVASESHDSLPVVGTIIRAMQVIYVNRFSSSSRKNAVDEIKGTTTNGRFLISFQRGAFVPGFPIQPVIVRYPYVHFDQSWGNVSVAKLMFRMFTQFHNFMEVEYLPVIQSLQCPNDSVPIFAERTAYAMATALNVVQTSHAYGDMMLLVKAQESKQENPSRFMVELAHRDLGYHISTVDALEFLEKFLSMNPDNSGSINFEDFLRALRLKPCSLSEKIFAFVDVNRTGRIDFKQFLLASTKIMKQPLFQRALELSFARCRTGALDHISQKEIAEVIRGVIPNANHDDVRELSALLDVDGDGRISKQDFFNCLTRNPLLIALFSPLLNNISHSSNGILEETV